MSSAEQKRIPVTTSQTRRDTAGCAPFLSCQRKVDLNLPEARLGELLKALRAVRNPTVSHLANREWVAGRLSTRKCRAKSSPLLKGLGAEGIIEYPLNKLVY